MPWNESNLFTEKLLAEWLRYEDEYGELIQWMKTTENSMKAESELKASLEEKTIQYEKQNVSFPLNLWNVFSYGQIKYCLWIPVHMYYICKGYKLKTVKCLRDRTDQLQNWFNLWLHCFKLRHIYITIEIWSTHRSKFQCLYTYARISKKKSIMSLIFQAIQEKITSKQEAFDSLAERAQTLLQSTTDNRVTSQLTQLSSRYTSLIASSKVSISYIIFKDT